MVANYVEGITPPLRVTSLNLGPAVQLAPAGLLLAELKGAVPSHVGTLLSVRSGAFAIG